MKEYGYYMWFRGQDNFFKTDHQRLTKAVIKEILEKLMPNVEISDRCIELSRSKIFKATYEVKALSSSGRKYCDIYGKNFGCGDFLDNYSHEHHFTLSK